MSGEEDENEKVKLLNFTLRKDYFINKNLYFENLVKQCSDVCHKGFCKNKLIYQTEDFGKKIKEQKILYDYYEKAKKNIEKENTIEILKNGLFIYDKKMLLYCVRDEETEDKFLSNVNNIKCIDHSEYDNPQKGSIKKGDSTKSYKSNSKYEKDSMTGLKNRALVLESLVNYFFKQFPIMPLPNLIINLDYIKKAKKFDTSINLFFEWDGCYFLDGDDKSDISFEEGLTFPFYNEMKYKITKKDVQTLNNNILIKKDSIILIEVKTHFPKEIEEEKNNNLENIIKIMFSKLNYFVNLYSKILLKKVKEIKIILLYDQQRLINYKNNISQYIEKYKLNFVEIDSYNLYFDIIYIIPYISKISLNQIGSQLSEANKRIKNLEDELALIKIKLNQLEKNNIEKNENRSIKKVKCEKTQMNAKLLKTDENIKSTLPKKTENVTPEYNNKITNIYSNILKGSNDYLLNENIKNIERHKSNVLTPKIKQTNNSLQIVIKNDIIINERLENDNNKKNSDKKKIKNIEKIILNTPKKLVEIKKEPNEQKYIQKEKDNSKLSKYEKEKDNKQKSEEIKVYEQEINKAKIKKYEQEENFQKVKEIKKYEQGEDFQKIDASENYKQEKDLSELDIAKKYELKKDEETKKDNTEKDKYKKLEDEELDKKELNQNEAKSECELKIDDKQKLDLSQKVSKKGNKIISIKLVGDKKGNMDNKGEKILKKKINISDTPKNENINQEKIKERSGNTCKDSIYEKIQLKLNKNEILLEKEKAYIAIYENCQKELNDENFSLMDYKTNHCSGAKARVKDSFHKALKNLTKEQRNLFFTNYGFLPCMSVCSKLI